MRNDSILPIDTDADFAHSGGTVNGGNFEVIASRAVIQKYLSQYSVFARTLPTRRAPCKRGAVLVGNFTPVSINRASLRETANRSPDTFGFAGLVRYSTNSFLHNDTPEFSIPLTRSSPLSMK